MNRPSKSVGWNVGRSIMSSAVVAENNIQLCMDWGYFYTINFFFIAVCRPCMYSKRLLCLFKIEAKDCFLISHVLKCSSKKYIEALLRKYDVAIVNNHLTKTVLLKIFWNKFSIILTV